MKALRLSRLRRLGIGSAALLLAVATQAAENAADRVGMATNQLKQLAGAMSARCLEDVKSVEDWRKQRPELRRQLLDMLGLEPLPKRTPLKAEVTGALDRPGYRIEKIVFQSLPGLYVTGNFYVPRDAAGPRPTILYLCGHSPHPFGAKTEYQARAAWYGAHGFACLILDTLEFGEVPGIHHGTHNLNMWNWLSLGYTPAGVEVWNAMRALDYLESRPEVDARRLGLTGISGGGAITWYTAAVDERVAVAAPVCSTFTFGSQADHWLAPGQCDCIYYHNSWGWDFPMVAALIAPRPLLMISGQQDTIFPPDGYHAVFQRAKRVYDLYAGGDSDRVRELDDNVGHSDPPLFLNGARQWMRRWLKNDATPIPADATAAPPAEKAEDLACLRALPADAANFRIQQEFIAAAVPKVPRSRTAWTARRAELIGQLKARVFRWFPRETTPFGTEVLNQGGGWAGRYAEYKSVAFNSEAGVRIRAELLRSKNHAAAAPLLVYVKRPGDTLYGSDWDELLPLLGRMNVLVLYPRFTEQALSPAEHTDVERTAVWLGRTIASMQVWDILRGVEWARQEAGLAAPVISLYGKGDLGVLALYAAVLEERVNQVIMNDPPASHWQRPALLNVLRVTDIAEVAGALAPRRLVCLTPPPGSFELTRRIFRLEGAEAQFAQAKSLPEALELWRLPRAQ